jgi:hypothetical protein
MIANRSARVKMTRAVCHAERQVEYDDRPRT